jgi:hypothetical protein
MLLVGFVVTDDAPAYRPRKPSSAPSEGSLAERDAFTALARQSLPEVRASAEAWRNGLTAFLTLVTTGVIIKGRDTTAGLPTSWRVLVTVFIGGGLALAVAGLWRVLAAQAGTRYRLSTREDIRRRYGTVEAYQIAVADRATDDLDVGRRLVVAALMNHPGFRAHLPSWEGCRDAEQVRQADQGEGGSPGQGSCGRLRVGVGGHQGRLGSVGDQCGDTAQVAPSVRSGRW